METDAVELKVLILSLMAIICIESSATLVTSESRYLPIMILGAVRLVETVLIVLIVLIRGKGLSAIGLAPATIVPGLKKGLIWSAVTGLFTAVSFALLFAAGINPLEIIQTKIPVKPGAMIFFFCIGGVIGPVAEEVFFRGILYGFFRRWGVWVALVLSTLMFVFVHPHAHGLPLPQLAGGILFAVAYEMGGSLMVPISIHVLGNLAIFTISMMMNS
ncbi:MAG: CPBP family intramembrane metalloprotease [Deltaproteobacteria bacterium]|nr:CPBP family intramembrane metalloprotease [Deltaproteobacteria bacterium]MBW2192842.1 CPBP family intramembrane metalloprotease [Deltaproteobacteria bacterium]